MESGATSGWPGTDWVEDILLQQAGPKTYEKWAHGEVEWTDESVRKAWTTWGEMLGTKDRKRMEKALRENYGENCPNGRLEHQGSFRASRSEQSSAEFVHSSVVIPDADADAASWEVSGDLVVMLNGSPEAKELIRYLASPETALPDYTVNERVKPDYENATSEEIGQVLRAPTETHCWDASDVMPGPMRDAFYQAVLHHLISPEQLVGHLEMLEETRKKVREKNNQHDETKLPVCDTAR
jgi:alpha-glucoside transport system substrate-binding protein